MSSKEVDHTPPEDKPEVVTDGDLEPEARSSSGPRRAYPQDASSGERSKSRPDYRTRRPERRPYSPETVDDVLEATSLPETSPTLDSPYHRGDKIGEDYQDRHRGDSIWSRGPEFLSDSRYDRSGNRNGKEDRPRSHRPARPDRDRNDRQERGDRRERPRAPYKRPDPTDSLEPVSGARGHRGEPITLAEELALERQGHFRPPQREENEKSGSNEKEMFINQLNELSLEDLIAEARKENVETIDGEDHHELVFRILRQRIRNAGMMFGEGTLEILPDEFGFLRSPDYQYISCPDDIYISPSQIRRFGLRNGLTISGQIRPPKERERYFALLRVEAINHESPSLLATKTYFDDLVATHPDSRIILEHDSADLSTRVVDLIVPIGFGQRGLIVSPPRAGKTILLQKIARAVLANYPECYVFILLIDERPEEVTDMEREIKGPHCEVVSSTFDEPPIRHIQVSEMVLEKAKRMVEYGKNVVIFLDSITRLARAWNTECPDSGKTLSGGVDANALTRPKKFFGSARKVEGGGSLTIIASALVDTGSAMDEVIFEEFKGTGNLEIRLDRSLVDKRIWPAIDIPQSGTRREEMILDPDELRRMAALRRILADRNPVDAMEFLVEKLGKYKKNAEFLMSLKME